MANWRPLVKGPWGGRVVDLYRSDDGDLQARTTQATTTATPGSFEPGSTVLPVVVSEGDPIHIDATDADDLEAQLRENGFSDEDAKDIARHARNP